MGAESDDMAVLEDDDLVGVGDREHPLGDDDHGGVLGHGLQGPPESGIGGHVEGGERVIEQVQLGAPDQRPGDGEALSLAARDVGATLGDRRVESPWHLPDEVGSLGDLERRPHFGVAWRRACRSGGWRRRCR